MNTQRKLIAAMSLCAIAALPNIASAISVSGQGTWETTLQGRDLDNNLATFEAYYDTVLNITWLADTNYAMTSGYDADGRMNWSTANAWAAVLNPYDSGITGWRLPVTVDVGNNGATYTNIYQGVDYGYNITTHSEMSHMFYVTLGNTAYYTASGVATGCTAPAFCLTNTGNFSNLLSHYYWSDTEYALEASNAWVFGTGGGVQGYGGKIYNYSVWAVRDGDVYAASTVPVPAAAWLLGSGLFGLLSIARMK